MLTLADAWPIISGAIFVVFGAGILVEKIRNGKYVTRDKCSERHRREDERWALIKKFMEDNREDHLEIFRLLRERK
jgi:hypothetical protein